MIPMEFIVTALTVEFSEYKLIIKRIPEVHSNSLSIKPGIIILNKNILKRDSIIV